MLITTTTTQYLAVVPVPFYFTFWICDSFYPDDQVHGNRSSYFPLFFVFEAKMLQTFTLSISLCCYSS